MIFLLNPHKHCVTRRQIVVLFYIYIYIYIYITIDLYIRLHHYLTDIHFNYVIII